MIWLIKSKAHMYHKFFVSDNGLEIHSRWSEKEKRWKISEIWLKKRIKSC